MTRQEFAEFVFVHDRVDPAAFLLQILISLVNGDEKANPLVQETCKIIRSAINIASSCLFPTDNHKIL